MGRTNWALLMEMRRELSGNLPDRWRVLSETLFGHGGGGGGGGGGYVPEAQT